MFPPHECPHIRRLVQPQVLNQLSNVLDKVPQTVAGGRLVRLPMTPQIRRDDVVAIVQVSGNRCPGLAEARPSVNQQEIRCISAAPLQIMKPDALGLRKAVSWFLCAHVAVS